MAILSAIAVLLLAVWSEFGVSSPWFGSVRTGIHDYRIHELRKAWRPPCVFDGWNRVELGGLEVPVPECMEYEIHPSSTVEGGPILLATDPGSERTTLSMSAYTVSPGREERIRNGLKELFVCSVIRDDNVLMWTCLGEVNVLSGQQFLSVSLDPPAYLEDVVRDREAARAIEIAEEFVRMQRTERAGQT